MNRAIARAIAAALFGALAGAAGLGVAYFIHPAVVFEMDRDLPGTVSGFYPVERSGQETFAWASRLVQLSLPGASRRTAWTCSLRFRGGRPDGHDQPDVELAIDGVPRAKRVATNAYQEVEVTAPPRPGAGLVFTTRSSTTFVPSPDDRRELAMQVDSLACRPAGGGLVLPPRRAIVGAALAAAAFGAAFVLAGVSLGTAAGAVLVLAATQAFPLSTGAAPFGAYADRAMWLACWIALLMLVLAQILEWRKGEPLRRAARFVVVFTAGALYLKLLGLLHPSKLPIDVVFQAHRLEWVLDGRFLFTQPMPSGVEFPYAIALYVVAAPWSLLTRDYVSLLRIVVCAAEAIAGGLLYVMISRAWDDRRAGAVAAALFSVVPVSYGVIGNANLTNAFGQSAALVTLAAATVWPLQGRHLAQTMGLTLLTAIALLSHVSTFALLGTTLVALAALCWWFGGPSRRLPARSIFLATLVAAVLSVVIYYGHFGDVYRNLGRTRAPTTAAAPPAGSAATPGQPAANVQPATALSQRLAAAFNLTVWSVGWPILILACAGAWRVWSDRARDRLVLLLAAWGVAFLVFAGIGIIPRVNTSFERYAAEFIGRVDYAAYPAAVILAGRGAAWAWRAGRIPRFVSVVLLVGAVVTGGRYWVEWFV